MSYKTTTYPYLPDTVQRLRIFDGISATTDADAIDISGAKKVAVVFSSDSAIAGSRAGTLSAKVGVSTTKANLETYNMFIDNLVNGIAQHLTRVASATINAASDEQILWMTPETLGVINNILFTFTLDTAGSGGTFTVDLIIQW